MTRTIRVLANPTIIAESKSLLGDKAQAVLSEINIEQLKSNLKQLSQDIGELFSVAEQANDFKLKQVEVGIEVSTEGGVHLIGTLTAGAKAAITLTFERS
jgi:hypothetical protein